MPFGKRKIDFLSSEYVVITNSENKKGLYRLTKNGIKTVLDSIYDEITVGADNILVKKNGKLGLVNLCNRICDIPVKYKDISYIDIPGFSNFISLYSVRDEKGKYGAYCYKINYHERYDYNCDRGWKQRYIDKRFIPTLFDSIEPLHFIFDKVSVNLMVRDILADILFKVSVNGKYGVLAAYQKKFLVSPIFDEINIDEIAGYFKATLNGENYLIDFSGNIYKVDKVELKDSLEVDQVKRQLSKKGFSSLNSQ